MRPSTRRSYPNHRAATSTGAISLSLAASFIGIRRNSYEACGDSCAGRFSKGSSRCSRSQEVFCAALARMLHDESFAAGARGGVRHEKMRTFAKPRYSTKVQLNAVVLDLGGMTTRAGWAGENIPSAVFPSVVGGYRGGDEPEAETEAEAQGREREGAHGGGFAGPRGARVAPPSAPPRCGRSRESARRGTPSEGRKRVQSYDAFSRDTKTST